MIKMKVNDKAFFNDMNNIIKYSVGFLDGVKSGKQVFLKNLGTKTVELLKEYVDTMANVSPEILHHVYEWNQTGSPSARLFDLDYTVSNLGLSIKSSFKQSSSIKDGSNVPFYDKAKIMENGIPVVIKPKRSSVLAFDDDGEQVFTKLPVTIENPGGMLAEGGFQKTMDSFFKNYFSQAFLRSSGIADYLESPVAYKKNLPAGRLRGKSAGVSAGYRWIANAGVR